MNIIVLFDCLEITEINRYVKFSGEQSHIELFLNDYILQWVMEDDNVNSSAHME